MPIERPPLMFGVELEQLPEGSYGDCYACDGSGETYVESEYGHEHTVDCDECNGRGTFEDEGDGTPEIALHTMRQLGLTTHTYIHEYHCDCRECEPFRRDPLLAAQTDCTVGIEWVSRAMRSPSNLLRIIEGHEAVMDATGWKPDGYETAGNHIHIGIPRDLRATQLATEVWGLAVAVIVQTEWDEIANGGCQSGRVRRYNNKGQMVQRRDGDHYGQEKGYTGSFIAQKRGGATFEYRLWNTPRDQWRIAAHAGLSMAITRWALHHAEMHPDVVRTPLECLDYVADISLSNIAEQWLPTNWPHYGATIELASTGS